MKLNDRPAQPLGGGFGFTEVLAIVLFLLVVGALLVGTGVI